MTNKNLGIKAHSMLSSLVFFLVVVAVAVEVTISTKHEDSVYGQIYSDILDLGNKISDLRGQFDLLKARNSYLR